MLNRRHLLSPAGIAGLLEAWSQSKPFPHLDHPEARNIANRIVDALVTPLAWWRLTWKAEPAVATQRLVQGLSAVRALVETEEFAVLVSGHVPQLRQSLYSLEKDCAVRNLPEVKTAFEAVRDTLERVWQDALERGSRERAQFWATKSAGPLPSPGALTRLGEAVRQRAAALFATREPHPPPLALKLPGDGSSST